MEEEEEEEEEYEEAVVGRGSGVEVTSWGYHTQLFLV